MSESINARKGIKTALVNYHRMVVVCGSESINARKGIKTFLYPFDEPTQQGGRSESINARKGIKTEVVSRPRRQKRLGCPNQ